MGQWNGRTNSFWSLACGMASLLSVTSPQTATAHPVVFADGTAVMGHHQGAHSELEIVHSPTYRSGLGLSVMREKDEHMLLGKASALLWRGNFPDYQSNLYFGLMAGRAWGRSSQGTSSETRTHSDANSQSALYGWNTAWDGEDRQIYSTISMSQLYQGQTLYSQAGKLRLGFAPYIARSDELTTWGIVEWRAEQKASRGKWHHEITPMVRLFYRNALIEVGSSLNGHFLFSYMFHFFN